MADLFFLEGFTDIRPSQALRRVPPPSLIPKGGTRLGGVTGERGENLRGIEDAIKGLGCRLGRR